VTGYCDEEVLRAAHASERVLRVAGRVGAWGAAAALLIGASAPALAGTSGRPAAHPAGAHAAAAGHRLPPAAPGQPLTAAQLAHRAPAPIATGYTAAHAQRTYGLSTAGGSGGSYVFDGHGFGSGVGLDQWGADGAASRGNSYARILAHYYPHTRLVTWRQVPGISVQITEGGAGPVKVAAASGLEAVDPDKRETWDLPASVGGSRVSDWRIVRAGAAEELDWTSGGQWHAWTPPGASGPGHRGTVGFTNPQGTVRAVLGGGLVRDYSGTLSAVETGGALATVNEVTLRQYIDGVVPSESPASWPRAALEAQAVAARSYALAVIAATPANAPWDICDTDYCQVYGGASADQPSSDAAVADTARQVLDYDHHAALAEYGASDGGWTAAGGEPYLAASSDPWDSIASPEHSWRQSVSTATIESVFTSVGKVEKIVVKRRDGHGQWGGRVLDITVSGSRGSTTVGGWTFASDFGFMSNWFTVASTPRAATGQHTDGSGAR
jgi:stage II sporulation protein D